MRNPISLTQEFDNKESEEYLTVPSSVDEAFSVPNRNWNGLIEDYNSINTKKFFLTPLNCKSIVEHVKRGISPQYMFKNLGFSKPRYHTIISGAAELEERFEILYNKENLTEEETEEFQSLLRHPLRILMMDVLRAEGLADLLLWNKFLEKADGNPQILESLMKARFREVFAERTPEATGINVQIKLGGDDDWIKKV
jgi:hypothetical protein